MPFRIVKYFPNIPNMEMFSPEECGDSINSFIVKHSQIFPKYGKDKTPEDSGDSCAIEAAAFSVSTLPV